MARGQSQERHDRIEAQIARAGNVGALERLAGIGCTQEARVAFWASFCKLPGAEGLDAGVAELKRRIRAQASLPQGKRRRGGHHHA